MFDCAMLDAAMLFNQIYIAKFGVDGSGMTAGEEWLNGGRGYYNIYRTRDGKSIFFGAIEEKLFRNFANRIGREELIGIRRRAESDPMLLIAAMEELFLLRDLAEWQEILEGCDCCFTPLNTVREALEDPQVRHRKLVSEVENETLGAVRRMAYPGLFDGMNIADAGRAPEIGGNTASILEELAFDADRIAALYGKGAVA